MSNAAPVKTTATVSAPRSGFLSWQFYVGLFAVLLTFVLGSVGITLPSNLNDILQRAYNNNIVPGVIGVALVAGFIAISFYFETRLVRRGKATNPGKPAPAGGKPFYQTSEFWLGLVTVALNYAEESHAFDQYIMIRPSAGTTTLVIALIYSFARAQLKQAYSSSQATDEKAAVAASK